MADLISGEAKKRTDHNADISKTDTIYRQAAIDALCNVDEYNSRSVTAIKNLPSAQPEIIRCKDCKKNPHWEWVGCPMTGKSTRKPDDFCSYAERREE